MLRRQRHAVQLVREQHLVAHRLGEREAARVVLLDPALDPVVEPGEDDLDRALADAGLLEQRAQRHPAPARRCRPPRAATAG